MILSNVEIIKALEKGLFSVEPSPGTDPSAPPFNTSALDLRLGTEINVPKTGKSPIQLFEEVRGKPVDAPNQFRNQTRPAGV